VNDVREGGCRCGELRFRAEGEPLVTAACHCTGCQRMTASAFSLTSVYPSPTFAVTSGEPVIGGARGAETQHFFCPSCMSWVFTRPRDMGEIVNVRSTLFDEVDPEPPFIETYTSEKLPWAETGAAHAFEAYPPPERFPELLASFAASRAGDRS
jgi:hypothetical protein